MAATRLNEMGRWRSDAIERQLAHQEPNAVRRAYTHGTEYWSERVAMMQAWADYLDELREGGESSRCDTKTYKRRSPQSVALSRRKQGFEFPEGAPMISIV